MARGEANGLSHRVGRALWEVLAPELVKTRELGPAWRQATTLVGALFALTYLYAPISGTDVSFLGPEALYLPTIPFHIFLPLYICFTGVLIFLLYPAGRHSPRSRPSGSDLLLAAATVAVTVEFIVNFAERGDRAGIVTSGDILFGTVASLLALEMCRRVLGPILPLLGFGFGLFNLFGPYFPFGLRHRGVSYGNLVAMLYSPEGIYGIIANTYATYVMLFVLFGAILQRTGIGDAFLDLAFSLAGRARGGAAKAAVISSGLVGSVVGSGAANIVITGTFTIPLMKRAGYTPHFAAATEAVASIGGHLMPPVMGAAAFVLAALTETDYGYVALISVVPAILYYASLFMSVHYEACKRGIVGLPREALPDFWKTIRKSGPQFLPIVVLIALLVARFSAFYAAFWSIVACLVTASVRRETRLGPRAFVETLAAGARNSLVVGATAGVMGIVLAGVTLPGLALRFSSIIISYSMGLLPLALVLVAIASYVLGMGMTITASYIILAILAGPALVDLGVPVLVAHLVVFWLSQDAALTPPFALGAFVAAGIAGSEPMRTGFTSLRLAKPLYVIPVLMVYTPLLTLSGTWPEIIATWLSSFLGFVCSSAALEGYLLRRVTVPERVLLGVAAVALFWPHYLFDLAGLALFGAILLSQRRETIRDVAARQAASSRAAHAPDTPPVKAP